MTARSEFELEIMARLRRHYVKELAAAMESDCLLEAWLERFGGDAVGAKHVKSARTQLRRYIAKLQNEGESAHG